MLDPKIIEIASNFFKTYDNLVLALRYSEPDAFGINKGVQNTLKEMEKTFATLNIFPFETDEFDPRYCEAVMCVNNPNKPDNAIVETLQYGFMDDEDFIIRPARVTVNKHQ